MRLADVAQLVEQRIRNAKVGGSTPLIGTKFSLGTPGIKPHDPTPSNTTPPDFSTRVPYSTAIDSK